jgi:hypothetical protein
MLWTLFAFPSLGFLGLLVISTLLLMPLVEAEKSWWALFALLFTGANLVIFGNLWVIPWVSQNYELIALGLVVYVAVGALWAVFKFYLFLANHKEKYIAEKQKWMKEYAKKGATPEATLAAFREFITPSNLAYHWHQQAIFIMPNPTQHKAQIIHWMSYWPWSVINFIFFDVLRKMWNHIYNIFADLFRYMVKARYADLMDDFKSP